MFRAQAPARKTVSSFPRVRGDVPWWRTTHEQRPRFSPRARGCSSPLRTRPCSPSVFPACAGMFLRIFAMGHFGDRFPRVRGDVPFRHAVTLGPQSFSPRARGCSHELATESAFPTVFPAHAGMFRSAGLPGCGNTRFPRARGDVPETPKVAAVGAAFSPRTRGCSV